MLNKVSRQILNSDPILPIGLILTRRDWQSAVLQVLARYTLHVNKDLLNVIRSCTQCSGRRV